MADYRTSIEIRATPDEVFDYLVTPAGMTLWMGEHAVLEPTPGGVFQVDIKGSPIRGRYLEVVRPHRVVVSWGVAGDEVLPSGASRVSFRLTATDHGTRVDLLHAGLPEPRLAGHAHGWAHFLPRLTAITEGGSPTRDDDWRPLPSGAGRADYPGRVPKDTLISYAPVDPDGLVVATLDGELDLDRADKVRDSLGAAAVQPECRFLQVDVSQLTFIDSYALGALVSARNTAAAAGVTLTLTSPSGPVRKAIEVTGLADVFGLPASG